MSALPDRLRRDTEQRSGLDLDGVRVHRDSPAPAAVGAAAFTAGDDIHLGPGADRHLAHEAWHVVQQRQGRVPATGTVSGLAVNTDPSLEREADHPRALAPSPAPALAATDAPVLQGVFNHQGATEDGTDRWLDTDSNSVYEAVAWHGEGVVTVREVGTVVIPGTTVAEVVLRRTDAGEWVPSALTDQESGGGPAMIAEEGPGPLLESTGQATTGYRDQAEQQLLAKGLRLARLSTGFTAQVDVAPLAQGSLADPGNARSQVRYGPDDVAATGLTVGNQDRPNTYLEPKGGQSGIPQGRHTVAWSFLRRSFMAMAGWPVGRILRHLEVGIEEAARLLQGPEGSFLLAQTQVQTTPGEAVSTLTAFTDTRTVLPIEAWQSSVSSAIRYYAQLYHLSNGATFAGKSTSRDESGGLRYLQSYEERLAGGGAATEQASALVKAAEKLIDAPQTMKPAAYAFAVSHWIELLGDVYPHVMQHHGFDIVTPRLTTKLGKTFAQTLGPDSANATVADLLAHYGYPMPFPIAPATEQEKITVPGALAAFPGTHGGSTEFVATVALAEALADGGDVTGAVVPGRGNSSVTVRTLAAAQVEVHAVTVSDHDRPQTQFGTQQNSHTVAWTLLRAELASLSGKTLDVLLDFLIGHFTDLSAEDGPHRRLTDHALAQLSPLRNQRRPIHLWQSDISLAVKWYAHAHQLAPSTTFYDAKAHGAFSHGEPAHMAVLRANELSAYNEHRLVHDADRVTKAAYSLMDVAPTLTPQARRTAFLRWKSALCHAFPTLMRGMGAEIVGACVTHHGLQADLRDQDRAL